MTDRQLGDYLAALFDENQLRAFFDEDETPECWVLEGSFRDEVTPFIHSRAALQARIENQPGVTPPSGTSTERAARRAPG